MKNTTQAKSNQNTSPAPRTKSANSAGPAARAKSAKPANSAGPAPRAASAKPTKTTTAACAKDVNNFAYSEIVKKHFLHPLNFLMGDESKYKYDAVGTVGNPICGDQMRMYLQIKDDKIADIKWKTYGCASAIASTSALSELAKGKTLDEALKIGPEEIADFLGGLPKHKFHCSVLGHEALAAAIEDYKNKRKTIDKLA